jgi:hypothetical protein
MKKVTDLQLNLLSQETDLLLPSKKIKKFETPFRKRENDIQRQHHLSKLKQIKTVDRKNVLNEKVSKIELARARKT